MPNAQELERLNVLPDDEVVSRVVEGETELFEILMRRHNERIYRAARAITRDADEAEDVVQHTHVKAFSHLRQFTGRAQFSNVADNDRGSRSDRPGPPARKVRTV